MTDKIHLCRLCFISGEVRYELYSIVCGKEFTIVAPLDPDQEYGNVDNLNPKAYIKNGIVHIAEESPAPDKRIHSVLSALSKRKDMCEKCMEGASTHIVKKQIEDRR